ncbi:MAG: CYTH domain-containing protein [Hyphomicrobiales bacterium]|nr:MAG: CYTH domain-containing protein [Hyphomicrobiales bacterium]
MALEIERKFLLADDTWRAHGTRSERLRDGLVAADSGRKVRVRIYEKRSTLTVKSKEEAGTRAEFEYDIPRPDALELLEKHSSDIIVKTRHYVVFEGFTWEIDEYADQLAGIIIAEVELPALDVPLPLPPWAGKEVTGLPEYKKINMLRRRPSE